MLSRPICFKSGKIKVQEPGLFNPLTAISHFSSPHLRSPMKPTISRITGLALVIAAVLGLILSLAGLLFLGSLASRTSASLLSTLDGLDQALTIAGDGLAAAETSLQAADKALDSLASTLDGVNESLRGMDPTLTALSTLLGTDLPGTINATQDSLDSAQTSAKNIDSVLTSLSRIPFLGSLVYNPEVPLNETLGDISDSLNAIPRSLREAKRGLDTADKNLDTITLDLASVSQSTDQMGISIADGLLVIDEYQTLVSNAQNRVKDIQQRLPGQLRLATLAAALLFIWLAIAQIGLLTQGAELIARARKPLKQPGIE
jgi:chromosome segregation ATPase